MKFTKLFWLFSLVLALLATVVLGSAQDRDRDRARRGGACFYKDEDFRGDKFCVNAGERVATIPPGFNDRISSIRVFGHTEITLYQDSNFGGRSLRIREDVANLQNYQVSPGHSWNDRVSSIEAGRREYDDRDGNRDRDYDRDRDRDYDRDQSRDYNRDSQSGACFYKDENFRGDKFCMDRGERMATLPGGFNDQISSIQVFGRSQVTVYQDENFGGPSLRLNQDVPNLQNYQVRPGHSWNDRISSIIVR